MKAKQVSSGFSLLVLFSLLLTLISPASAAMPPAAQGPVVQTSILMVEPQVREEIAANGQTDFFIWMAEKADLSPASQLATKAEKGKFVFDTLTATAEHTQKDLRAYLDAQGIEYRAYYIANKILVRGGTLAILDAITTRRDVEKVTANHPFQLQEPFKPQGPTNDQPNGVEGNIAYINADDAWAIGITGEGMVLAGNDTGLDETVSTVARHYRGCLNPPTCSEWDHNYNWWDATGVYPTNPYDGFGHGTHTTGTMIGDDGGANQIGVAPGAQTIHCKNMTDGGSGDDSTFTECFEWDLAPWNLSHTNPDPTKAPDAINNSWGYWGGNNPVFEDEIAALQAAGILVEVSAGNEGVNCGTLRSPGDYLSVLTTGSISDEGHPFPGIITANGTWSTSRGPSSLYPGDYFPDIMAPGDNVRSQLPGGAFESWGGTSMAGPHATALIALIWQAGPSLRGDIETTMQIIRDTAAPLTGQAGSNCGGDYTVGPNNDWGFGTIDAFAAVQAAMAYAGGELEGTVTDATSLAPIRLANVTATDGEHTFTTQTDAEGFYQVAMITGTFTVTFTAFGFSPETVADVEIIKDQTTQLDVSLDRLPSFTVSGNVSDGTTGWPLYANLSVDGTPVSAWTDPVTGDYVLMLPAGGDYAITADAWVPGYNPLTQNTGALNDNLVLDFALDPDLETCSAPGYTIAYDWFENFESGNGGFVTSGVTSWAYGTPTSGPNEAHSGTNVWATNLSGSYNNNENGAITSPTIDLSAMAGSQVTVSWWQWLQTESNYDYAYVEVSNNNGSTWTTIYGPVSGTIDTTWTLHQIPISSIYAVSTFKMRFRFTSDSSVINPGWYVDDIGITEGTLLPCIAPTGGLIAGNVLDANTGSGLNEAQVASDTGESALTYGTPEDPALEDGFYVMYGGDAGDHVLTASLDPYGSDTQTTAVVAGDTVWQEFHLTAGYLTLDPPAFNVEVGLGAIVSRELTLTNPGTVPVTWSISDVDNGYEPPATGNPTADALWLTELPSSGTLDAGESITVEVAFDASAIALEGTYLAEIQIDTDTPYDMFTLPVMMTVTQESLGVELTPETMELSGYPGRTVTYILELSNTGNVDDVYDITVEGIDTGWSVAAPTQVAVPAGETATLEVNVTLPANAEYDPDTIVILAASQADDTIRDSSTLTTTVEMALIFLPAISKP